MQLTRAADYAVRIMTHLAVLPAGARRKGAKLATAAGIPGHFVVKILQMLVRARLIDSQPGSGGLAADHATIRR